ncbi:MAG TPA: hypothetical protein VGG72_35850 [Bryobacteraceae bacterium]|jgi:hypothetical protein
MKLLTVFLAAGVSLFAADLSGVKSIYLMPMSGGLDQYLANRLAKLSAIQVVTDPQKADAIFTDRIGVNFEQSLDSMYAEKKKSDGKMTTEDFTRPTSAPGTRGKGSLFLVDRQTRVILWSTFATAKSNAAGEMNQLAIKVAEQFDKDRAGKK